MASVFEPIRRFSSWADVTRLERRVEEAFRRLASIYAPRSRVVDTDVDVVAQPGDIIIARASITVTIPDQGADATGLTVTVRAQGAAITLAFRDLSAPMSIGNARTYCWLGSEWLPIGDD